MTEARYRRAVRRARRTTLHYREQWALSGATEPVPTPVAALPDPPHTLRPFTLGWSPEREPPLWTPPRWPLRRALRLAGCGWGRVVELRPALLDHRRLGPRRPYGVLLSPSAVVTSPEHRAALSASTDVKGWVVGGPEELASLPAGTPLRPVLRLPIAAAAGPAPAGPALLFEPRLGYLGALRPRCRRFHLDRHVYARERSGTVTLSLLGRRSLILLDVVPPAADSVRIDRCPRHATPILVGAG